jgi:hypothetical protein
VPIRLGPEGGVVAIAVRGELRRRPQARAVSGGGKEVPPVGVGGGLAGGFGSRSLLSLAGVAQLCNRPTAALPPGNPGHPFRTFLFRGGPGFLLGWGVAVHAGGLEVLLTLGVGQDRRGGALALGWKALFDEVRPLLAPRQGLEDGLTLQRRIRLAARLAQSMPVLYGEEISVSQ